MSLKIIFWDVQHGSSTYIKTPGGQNIVQDMGTGSYSSNSSFSPLLHLKEKYDVQKLDSMIITHPHKDHIDDILNFDKVKPYAIVKPRNIDRNTILSSARHEDLELFEKYFEIDKTYNYLIPKELNPLLEENNGGVKINTYNIEDADQLDINNFSIITVISYASSKIIIPGDNERASWEKLLKQEDFVEDISNSDIFVASHHGRESGFYSELFNFFKPRITVVSDGRFCDSTAVSRYSAISSGWEVYSRSAGNKENRKCLTTRNDGVIIVEFGTYNEGKPYIYVTKK